MAIGTVRVPLREGTIGARPFDISQFRLRSSRDVAALRPFITSMDHEQTIEGASTITVKIHDWLPIPGRRELGHPVLRSSVVRERSIATVDNVPYCLVKVARADDGELTLTLEELAVNLLRRNDRPKKAARDTVTRAQFIHGMIAEAPQRIPFRCPEMYARQPVARPDGGTTRVEPYEFSRGSSEPETSWDAMKRLADEVGWRRYCRAGTIWYVSDDWLRSRPPAFVMTEDTRGVNKISFEFETRLDAAEATVGVLAERYTILPGDHVRLNGQGPANGSWLVKQLSRSVFSKEQQVTLTRSQPKLEEPAQ